MFQTYRCTRSRGNSVNAAVIGPLLRSQLKEMTMNSRRFLIAIFAIIILPVQNGIAQDQEPKEWQSIGGDSLDDWSDPGDWWKAKDGVIVGESKGGSDLPTIHYLIWNKSMVHDFELSLEYRITATEPSDAGVHFRVERPVDSESEFLRGYQAELDTAIQFADQKTKKNEIRFIQQGLLFGHIHDGKRRRMFERNQTTTIDADGKEAKQPFRNKFIPARVYLTPPKWNTCRIHVEGNRTRLYLNNVLANEIIDAGKERSQGDAIALQFRPNKPYTFEVKDIKYRIIDNN